MVKKAQNNIKRSIESISVADFAAKLDCIQKNAIILDLGQAQTYARGHIPGAVHLPIMKIVHQKGYATGLLPSQAMLADLAQEYGLNSGKTVYVYDDEGGGWAGRMVWLLDILQVSHIVYIDGGLKAWMMAGYALTAERMEPVAGPRPDSFDLSRTVEFDEMCQLVAQQSVHIIDARSIGEYQGTRQYAQKAGRIPGAVHFEWTNCMNIAGDYTLRSIESLREALKSCGVDQSKPCVTYCQTHHRSGLVYLVCCLLDLEIRAYAGSWSEWGNERSAPVESDTIAIADS